MQMIALAFAVIAVCVAHLERCKATPLNCRGGQRGRWGENSTLTMRSNLEMLNRFWRVASSKSSHSRWSAPQIAILNLFIFAMPSRISQTREMSRMKRRVPLSGLFRVHTSTRSCGDWKDGERLGLERPNSFESKSRRSQASHPKTC